MPRKQAGHEDVFPGLFPGGGERSECEVHQQEYLPPTEHGFPHREGDLPKVTDDFKTRSDFGFDEEDYSRTFKFYLDDEKEPSYLAFQYTRNG